MNLHELLRFPRVALKRGIVFELLSENGVRSAVLRGFTELIPGKRDLIVPAEIIADDEKYSVLSVGDGVFENNEIRKIMFDRKITITRFSQNCFANSSTSAIEIPNSVSDIDETAFIGCRNLTKLLVKSTNPNFIFENGLLMANDRKELRFVAADLAEVKIPPEVEVICGYAFTGQSKVVLSIPEDSQLREIRADAFNGVEIGTLIIPPSLRVIDANAFRNMQGPTKISMFEDYDNPYFMEYLGLLLDRNRTELILGVTELLEASIPESIVRIRPHAFAGCAKLSTLAFTRNSRCTEIGEYAFYGTNLETVAFPSALQRVKSFAFANCVEMTSFEFPRESMFKYFEDSVFFGSSITTFAIPGSVTEIAKFAFDGMEWVTEIALSKANTALFEDTGILFSSDRKKLLLANKEFEKVIIPKQVEVLGTWSLGKCQYLTQLRLDPAGSSLIEICPFAVAFTYVQQFTVPSTVTEIGEGAFLHAALERVTFQEGSALRRLGKQCFERTKISSIRIPASVEVIMDAAFSVCKALKTVEFEPGSSLTTIGDAVFKGSSVSRIVLPGSVVSIGVSVFEGCPLETVEFGRDCKLSVIPELAFSQCRMTELRLPETIVSIHSSAFEECTLLRSLICEGESKLSEIWPLAFCATDFESVSLPPSVTLISNRAFARSQKLRDVRLTSSSVTLAGDIFFESPNATIRKDAKTSVQCANPKLPISEL